jgi:hypothetical protein
MGDRKSEAGSRVEAPQKKPAPPPIVFLLQHSGAPDSLAPLSGCLFRARRDKTAFPPGCRWQATDLRRSDHNCCCL